MKTNSFMRRLSIFLVIALLMTLAPTMALTASAKVAPTIGGKSVWEFGDTIEFGSEEFYYFYNIANRSVNNTHGDATLQYDRWSSINQQHLTYLFIHPTQYYIYIQPEDYQAETPQLPAGLKLVGGNGTEEDPYEFALWYKYTVNITPGANMTKISGEESQTVTEGTAITDVVYTADSGCFPDTYSVEAVNGVTVTRVDANTVKVSGSPTGNADITLTAPSAHQEDDPKQENVSSATCTAQGSYDNVTYCKYCGVELARETIYTDPLSHIWGAPSYTWADDNKKVTASRVCGRDASHVDSETVNTTSEVTKPATYTERGETTYTATFTKSAFQTQTKTVDDIPTVAPTQAPDAKMTVTVSNKGVLATAKDGKTAMLNQPFTAKDMDKNGSITVDEALVAAHEAYNQESGYVFEDLGGYSAVTRVWGVDTMNTLFAVNHVGLTNGVLVDTVEAGDKLSVSINKDDTYYADWYTYFVPEEVTAEAGEEVELTLMGHFGMAYMPEDLIDTPISGVQVGTWANGTFTPIVGAVTDEDGKVTLTFDKAGTYIVSAEGTVPDEVTVDWTTYATDMVDCPIIAPGCAVTVTAEEEVTVKAGEKTTLPKLMVDGKDVTKEAKWESSDSSVATVYNGTVTGKKQGTAVITATYDGQTYTFPVTVTKGSSGSSGSASGSSSTSSKPKPKNTIILTIDNKTVMVNGNAVENDVAPFIEKDRTMLPIRFIAETLGAKVEWDNDARQVRIEKDKTVILLTIDSDKAYVNDMAQILDSPAIIKSDRTFLPIRFVAENLGAAVDWNENARQVTITY